MAPSAIERIPSGIVRRAIAPWISEAASCIAPSPGSGHGGAVTALRVLKVVASLLRRSALPHPGHHIGFQCRQVRRRDLSSEAVRRRIRPSAVASCNGRSTSTILGTPDARKTAHPETNLERNLVSGNHGYLASFRSFAPQRRAKVVRLTRDRRRCNGSVDAATYRVTGSNSPIGAPPCDGEAGFPRLFA
jgi:hypothetical protein